MADDFADENENYAVVDGGDNYAQSYGGDEAQALQGFVVEDAGGELISDVQIILTDEEEEMIAGQKQRRVIAALVCCMLVIIAIVVPVSINASGGSGSGTQPPTESPTEQPSAAPSAAPTIGLLPQVITCLGPLTDFDTFQDRQNPQYKAVDWLVNDDPYVQTEDINCGDDRFTTRYVMAAIYFAMGGENWGECGRVDPTCAIGSDEFGWLSNNDVCSWFRVRCDETGESSQVVGFNFGSLLPDIRDQVRWVGDFPSEMRFLTSLIQIQLKDSRVTSIPEFLDAFSNLEELNLENNEVAGPFYKFTGQAFPVLRTMVLSTNRMTGTIPTEHGTLTAIREYRAGSNNLKGEIPDELANMELVAYIDLSENDLFGRPTEKLFELSELRILSLYSNDVSGTIPTTVGGLSFLERIRLNNTQYGGDIPQELYTLENLQEIKLREAKFRGIIDPLVQNLEFLQIFDVSLNEDISGSFPDVFGSIEFLGKLWRAILRFYRTIHFLTDVHVTHNSFFRCSLLRGTSTGGNQPDRNH
mmetsp:Transcript_13451/g.27860  ORF Transcript_13451/g.27860 Transcript_13451/m.27860 type:complete len:529 (-) Transcript_13451:889-2475(-)